MKIGMILIILLKVHQGTRIIFYIISTIFNIILFYSENGNCSNENSSSSSSGGRKRKASNKIPVFMTGVSGVKPFLEQPKSYNLQRKVQSMCGCKR